MTKEVAWLNCLVRMSDVMANLWGSESMLIEATVEPRIVTHLLNRMVASFRKMYDELYEMACPHQEGYFDWLCIRRRQNGRCGLETIVSALGPITGPAHGSKKFPCNPPCIDIVFWNLRGHKP